MHQVWDASADHPGLRAHWNGLSQGERMKIPDSPDSLPGCIGFYEVPIAANGPCEICQWAEVCRKASPQPVRLKVVRTFVDDVYDCFRVLEVTDNESS